MESKTLAYLGLGTALLLLVGTFAMGSMNGMSGKSSGNTEENMADHHNEGGQFPVSNSGNDMTDHHNGGTQLLSSTNEDLSEYRSEKIPSDCRLADYDNDVKKWAEHLSHHENTRYCLKYYENIGGK